MNLASPQFVVATRVVTLERDWHWTNDKKLPHRPDRAELQHHDGNRNSGHAKGAGKPLS